MRTIDIHAHLSPAGLLRAMAEGRDWHGLSAAEARDWHDHAPGATWTPEQRLREMDELKVDLQVLSPHSWLYGYEGETAAARRRAQECNDYMAELVQEHPARFAGLATLPMQDAAAAVQELERSIVDLGLKGAMIGDQVNGLTYDDPSFLPLWQAAEQLGAVIFIHQAGETVVSARSRKYHLPDAIGNPADRAVTYASFVFGGVMDACPHLKVILAHGGGYACFGAGRMDRGWQVRREARVHIQQPPSRYLSRFYYDCLTHSEPALRMLIDAAGSDRVLFGSDWPDAMGLADPVQWVSGLASLNQAEKDAILWQNTENLLGI